MALSMFGLKESDIEESHTYIEVHADLWETFLVFEFMSTQWRTDQGRMIGLDYNVLPIAQKAFDIPDDKMREVMNYIRVMESQAITTLSDTVKKQK